MNKLFDCNLEIQGKGTEHTSKVSCKVLYQTASLNSAQIEKYEHILEQVFKLVAKEFSKKPIYGEFEIKDAKLEFSLDSIEKDLLESNPIPSLRTFRNEDVRIEISNAQDWCYPHIVSDAMESFFKFHMVELVALEKAKQDLPLDVPEANEKFEQFKFALQGIMTENENRIDGINETVISVLAKKERYHENLEKELAKLEKKFYT